MNKINEIIPFHRPFIARPSHDHRTYILRRNTYTLRVHYARSRLIKPKLPLLKGGAEPMFELVHPLLAVAKMEVGAPSMSAFWIENEGGADVVVE